MLTPVQPKLILPNFSKNFLLCNLYCTKITSILNRIGQFSNFVCVNLTKYEYE